MNEKYKVVVSVPAEVGSGISVESGVDVGDKKYFIFVADSKDDLDMLALVLDEALRWCKEYLEEAGNE